MIWAWLTGKGLKFAGIGLTIAACFGIGFKKGLDWRADQVESAKATAAEQVAEADGKTDKALARAKQAEADYTQLRREYGAAIYAGQQQAIEQEAKHAESAKRVQVDVDKRIAGVLDHTKRMLGAVAKSGGNVRAGAEPQVCRERGLDDPAVERALIERAGECASAEERLRGIQQAIKEQ